MKVYVASSWRNDRQPAVVEQLRAEGHEVYDFRNPMQGDSGFGWGEIDPEWTAVDLERFRTMLDHPRAQQAFDNDFDAMKWADACVLVMPCGRSAHLEAGWFTGAGKLTVVLLSDGEPELMYKLADHICVNMDEVCEALRFGPKATVKAGWTMPEPPVEGAVPTYYNDSGEVYLSWIMPGGEGEPASQDVDCDIPWPFNEEKARHTELVAIGFVDAEMA